MLMVTYFYLQLMLLYASPLILLFALFMLKRGIRQCRKSLRQGALLIIYVIIFKMLTYDAFHVSIDSFCGDYKDLASCDYNWVNAFRIVAGLLLIPSTYLMRKVYNYYINRNNPSNQSMTDLRIRFWSNMAMGGVAILVIWLLAPWIGYLSVGSAPEYLLNHAWRYFALLCFCVIGMTFWRYEDCSIILRTREDKMNSHKAWVPRDTLWLATIVMIFIYPIMFFSESILLGK